MRPRKRRRVRGCACCKCFKPQGIPAKNLESVLLNADELEALRLTDAGSLDQIEAAKKMNISQSTLQRILTSARKKTADALISGKVIRFGENPQHLNTKKKHGDAV